MACRYVCPPEVERCRLGRDAEIALYRIVQEVLTNVSRHANARSVQIEAVAEDRDLVLRIVDDGQGMRVPQQPTSFALLGMRERALSLGAWGFHNKTGPMELNIPAIKGIGDSLIYFVDRWHGKDGGQRGQMGNISIYDVDFVSTCR